MKMLLPTTTWSVLLRASVWEKAEAGSGVAAAMMATGAEAAGLAGAEAEADGV